MTMHDAARVSDVNDMQAYQRACDVPVIDAVSHDELHDFWAGHMDDTTADWPVLLKLIAAMLVGLFVGAAVYFAASNIDACTLSSAACETVEDGIRKTEPAP